MRDSRAANLVRFLIALACSSIATRASAGGPSDVGERWQLVLGEPNTSQSIYAARPARDGGYVVLGCSQAYDPGWPLPTTAAEFVIRLEADGRIRSTTVLDTVSSCQSGSEVVFPLPDGGTLLTSFLPRGPVRKLDPDGNVIWSTVLPASPNGPGYGWLRMLRGGDGGFFLGSDEASDDGNYSYLFVVSVAANGAVRWSRHVGRDHEQWLHVLSPSTDGGVLLAGQDGRAVRVMRLGRNGDLTWDRTVDPNFYVRASLPTPDRGLLLWGEQQEQEPRPPPWARVPYFVRVDRNGRALWRRKLNGFTGAYQASVVPTEGGWLAALERQNAGNVFGTVELGLDGTVRGVSTYPLAGPEGEDQIVPATDGGFFLIGGSYQSPIPIVRIDARGAQLWSRGYEFPRSPSVQMWHPEADGGLLIGGTSSFRVEGIPFPNFVDRLFGFRIGADGSRLWSRTYGLLDGASLSSLEDTPDGGYLFAGTFELVGTPSSSFESDYLVKTDAAGNAGPFVPSSP